MPETTDKAKKREPTKKQHMVPQFYLRYFTSTPDEPDDRKRIWVYDKQRGVSRNDRIRDAAHENYFYDIPADALSAVPPEDRDEDFRAIDVQAMEHELARVEGWLSRHITDCIENHLPAGRFPQGYKLPLTVMLSLQSVRTRQARENATATAQAQAEALLEKMLLEEHGLRRKVELTVEPWRAALCQLAVMGDAEKMQTVYEPLIAQHRWSVRVNRTPLPFYTSDHPIVAWLTARRRSFSAADLNAMGATVAFPLTPRYALVLERTSEPRVNEGDGRVIEMHSVGAVAHLNGEQVRSSRRQVFCHLDEFRLAESLCNARTEYRDPMRKRKLVKG
jgi:hypothetical protein